MESQRQIMENSNQTALENIDRIEIILPNSASWQEYCLIPIKRSQREFWPNYKIDFNLQTDIGTFTTRVVGASAKPGNPEAGSYITKNIRYWFNAHPELRIGSILEAEKLGDLFYSIRVLER